MADDSSGLKYEHAIAVWYKKKAFFISEEDWKKNNLPEELGKVVADLVNNGAVLASIKASGQGVGCACYLLNLDNIVSDTRPAAEE